MLLVVVAVAGCTQQVRVDGDWQEGVSRGQSFSRVLVVGLSHNASGRCDFESFLTTQIRATGADAKSSCFLMKTTDPLTVESIEAAVAEYGADAVLTTVLVQADQGAKVGGKNDTRGGLDFKATGTGYASPYYYGGYRGGYGHYGIPVVYGEFRAAPLVTTLEGEVQIQSMLYATRDKTLVYELSTTANDLSSRDNALAAITPPIAQRLQREGLLPQ